MIRRTVLGAALLVGSLQMAGVAMAASAPGTAMDKAELAQLTPKLRSEVEARVKDGQTVHGVIETMLLNRVSADFASGKVVATDFARGDMVVQSKDGQMKVFPFELATLAVKS